MKAYSEDLRQKIVGALKRGTTKSEATRLFEVSLSSVKRFSKMDRQGGSLIPKKPPGRPRKAGKREERLLEADLAEHPAATASERRRYLEHLTGVSIEWVLNAHSIDSEEVDQEARPQPKKRSALARRRHLPFSATLTITTHRRGAPPT